MLEHPHSVWWLIEITAGHMTLYFYQDERTKLYGWTSIAHCGKKFFTAKEAHAEVSHTTGYSSMRIVEHLFA